jgi:hypothetical protein
MNAQQKKLQNKIKARDTIIRQLLLELALTYNQDIIFLLKRLK